MTYQRGLAPADAPVTWEYNNPNGNQAALYGIRVNGREVVQIVRSELAEHFCLAFHLAALAEEAKQMIRDDARKLGPDDVRGDWCLQWLRSYDAAKGAT